MSIAKNSCIRLSSNIFLLQLENIAENMIWYRISDYHFGSEKVIAQTFQKMTIQGY